jgi:hypothetical protein
MIRIAINAAAVLLSASNAMAGAAEDTRRLIAGQTTRRLFGYVGLLLSKATQWRKQPSAAYTRMA